MPIADELLGFQASLVKLGAAGAWCIHGTLLAMPVLTSGNSKILLLETVVGFFVDVECPCPCKGFASHSHRMLG